MSNLNVLLVDDHSVVRMGFKMLIDSEKDMQVIAEAETGEDGIIKFQEIKPDVIVMDITMPGIGGLEAIERIIAKDKNAKILVLSAHEDTLNLP
jgi:two-component system invasion response regulator UvrY